MLLNRETTGTEKFVFTFDCQLKKINLISALIYCCFGGSNWRLYPNKDCFLLGMIHVSLGIDTSYFVYILQEHNLYNQ
jgi:hypothetical protein